MMRWRQDEELRQAHELERVRGDGPYKHASTIEESTRQVDGG